MISKLPRWVWLGSAVLAALAGMVNAVGFLGFQHQGVTHLTGTTTLLGIAFAGVDLAETGHLLGVIGAFLAGCIASGAIVEDAALRLGRRYGIALTIESLMLLLAVPLLERSHVFGVYLTSCAFGLQNGMVSTYSGAVLRTTHVSGAFTDLGIFLGHLVRGLDVDSRRTKLCALTIGGFLTGAIVGAAGFRWLGYRTLYVPAAAVGAVGLGYSIFRRQRRDGTEGRKSDRGQRTEGGGRMTEDRPRERLT